MFSEWFFHGCGKHRVPVFVAFSRTHNYLISAEIDIFNPQLQTLHQSQTCAVEKHHHKPIGMIEDTEDRLHFLATQNHRKSVRPFRTNNTVNVPDLLSQHVSAHNTNT